MRSRVVGLLRPAPVIPLTAALLLLLLLLAGCSDDGRADRRGDGEGGDDATTGATTGPPTSDDSSVDATPSQRAATGEQVQIRSLSLHLTEGDWVVGDPGLTILSWVETTDPLGQFWVGLSDAFNDTLDLEELRATQVPGPNDPAKVRPDRTINGKQVLFFKGRQDGITYYRVAGLSAGHFFILTFEHPTGWAAGPEAVEEILASIEWK